MSDGPWRTWEDFLQAGTTDVPRNRFGITGRNELERVERIHSSVHIVELELSPLPGEFDLRHLQSIHRYIFQDVYAWAGIIRPFTLFKAGDEFCRPQFIEPYAADIFGRLHQADLLRDLDADTFVTNASDLLADVNALHAFREGNGRSQRAFLSQLAAQAGHPLVWPIGAEQRNIDASRAAHRGDNSELRALVTDALRPGRPPAGDSDAPPSADRIAQQSFPRGITPTPPRVAPDAPVNDPRAGQARGYGGPYRSR